MSIIHKLRNIYSNQYLLSRSFIVISAALVGNALAYLYQLIAGRYFSAEDYGVMNTLFSLTGVIPLILIFFTNGIPKLVAEIKDEDYPNRISKLFFTIIKINIVIAIVILALLLLFKEPIATYLQLDNSDIIGIYAMKLSVGILFTGTLPFLQGLMRFKAYSFLTFFGALIKFGSIILVASLGLAVTGLFTTLTIAVLFTGILSLIVLRKNIVNKINEFDLPDFKLLLKYSISASFAIIGFTSIQNMDVILVKHYFPPDVAGMYSSLVVIGRIIFFAASPVVIVMLPICAQKYKKGENYYRTFLMSLFLALIISTSIAVIYALIPETIITILFGAKYILASGYLAFYGLYMVIFTLMFIISQFFVAVSKFRLAALTIVGAISQFIGIHFYHNNINDIIRVNIFSVGIVLLLYIAILIVSPKHKIDLKT